MASIKSLAFFCLFLCSFLVFAQSPQQLKKLKAASSDLVGTFEVQGQGITSGSGSSPTQTNCNVNGDTVNCTSRVGSYSIDILHINGIFHAGEVQYTLEVVPFSYRCAFAQGFAAGAGGHAAACGTSLRLGTYVAKLSGMHLTVVSGDGKHKADYTVVAQSIWR
jgi:hypothetical protein